MDKVEIGQSVTVKYNGSHYTGTIERVRTKRNGMVAYAVRFTTGSGRTRVLEYGFVALAYYATNPSPRERSTAAKQRVSRDQTLAPIPTRIAHAHDATCAKIPATCPAPDLRVTDRGFEVRLRPLSSAAEQWLADNVDTPGASQYMNPRTWEAGELLSHPVKAAAIVHEARKAGLVIP